MGALIQFTADLEDVGECSECGVRHAMPSNMLAARRRDKQVFYCPNGHRQAFVESSTVLLQRELDAAKVALGAVRLQRDAARKERDALERIKAQALGKLKALKGRVKNGVCPCCQRSFVQLARHMATKHPDFSPSEP